MNPQGINAKTAFVSRNIVKKEFFEMTFNQRKKISF